VIRLFYMLLMICVPSNAASWPSLVRHQVQCSMAIARDTSGSNDK
jgi:hypothetical protein